MGQTTRMNTMMMFILMIDMTMMTIIIIEEIEDMIETEEMDEDIMTMGDEGITIMEDGTMDAIVRIQEEERESIITEDNVLEKQRYWIGPILLHTLMDGCLEEKEENFEN